jgi:hypothetical protein
MKSQTRTSRGDGHRGSLKFPLGLLGTLTALVSMVVLLLSAAPASAALSGAVFTTDSTCTGVDLNIYEDKDDVYLDGGPKKSGSAGLDPGVYYVKVTDPSGATLLGTTVGSANETPVEVDANGDFVLCYQLSAILIKASGLPGQIAGYDDTPNEGGEYKVWVSSESSFPNDEDKTDNFKVVVDEEEEIPPADALTASKDAHPSLARTYKWEIEKEVDETKIEIAEGEATFNYTVTVKHDEGTDSGWAVTGEIEVNNPNSGDVTGVDVEDAINDNESSCTVEGGSNATIEAESSETFPYECTYGGEPESSSETNTATVSWGEQTVDGHLLDEGEAEATAAVDWTEPAVELIDEEIEVSDSLGGPLGTVSYTNPSPETFEYSEEFEGVAGTCTEYDNKATFVTNDSGAEGLAEKTVEVCVGADLEVEKTARPSFNRTFPWKVSKEVDKTIVKQVGGNATFTYTIKITKGTGVDSDWVVKGTITVSNPNDWEAITADVTDAIDDANASCTVTGGDDVEIPASDSEELDYECTYSSAPTTDPATNTATATWDAVAAFTPSGSAEGTASIDWADTTPNAIDDCVKATDTVDGVPTTLDDPLCESKTYTPKLTFPVPASGCVTHNNVAAFITEDTGTTGEAKQSVQVCGPVDTGALTMGYWQNKNGQKIITDGATTAKVCNSATWLRNYAPFQDLSATATCKDVATYVTNIIKAANASGAAMNAMLKAQMLATALDVYFSDPALGGNQIKAPAPIGGQKIDLTKVCKNIAACTKYEDTSSAFGNATSLTVSQILAYAASQSNAGGSVWYGQSKATQELAKDTFDAINNEVAFGA